MSHQLISGPAGQIELVLEQPSQGVVDGYAFLMCHPHPQFQGTMDNKVVTTMTRVLTRLGVPAVRFNYRGVGQSEGAYDEAVGEIEDAKAVLHWLKKETAAKRIWVGGFSFGAYIAYALAQELGVEDLFTIAPSVENMAYETLANPNIPWHVLVGGADEVVSVDAIFSWLATHKSAFTLVKYDGVGHFFHGQLARLSETAHLHYAERLAEGV